MELRAFPPLKSRFVTKLHFSVTHYLVIFQMCFRSCLPCRVNNSMAKQLLNTLTPLTNPLSFVGCLKVSVMASDRTKGSHFIKSRNHRIPFYLSLKGEIRDKYWMEKVLSKQS